MALGDVRNDWTLKEIKTIMDQPFNDLIFQAQTVHRMYFDPNEVQTSTLVNIKSGGCAEDCAYCSQSARNQTEVEKEQMMEVQEVIEQALVAKEKGATRLCMGAAWRNPTKAGFPRVLEMVRVVKDLGLETCLTLGMLDDVQVAQLKEAGLDYYNHNLDTSEAFYPKSLPRVTTKTVSTPSTRYKSRYQRLLWRHYRHGRTTQRPCRINSHLRHHAHAP